jgi:hypothetical protein
MLTQGTPVNEQAVRTLRRDLATAGGSPSDAASTVFLSRLGLPVTPLSLGIARQILAGQLDPRAAWDEALAALQRLARGEGGPVARDLARDLLNGWRVPLEAGAAGLDRWLRAVVEQTALPLEAKLADQIRPESQPTPSGRAVDPSIGEDVRARLDGLTQALGEGVRATERGPAGPTLQRLQATIQAEQVLNASPSEQAGQRFFVMTLPAMLGQQPSSLELQVRERDARPGEAGEVVRPDVVRLKLSLAHLGDLAINLTVGQNSVACSFAASSSFSEALIGASSGELVGRLKRLGYQQTTVETVQQAVSPASSVAGVRPEPAPRVRHVDMRA